MAILQLPYLLLLFTSLLLISTNSAYSFPATDSAESQPLHKTTNVNLTLYYESLCPFSQNFIVHDLVKLFDANLFDIVNLRMVPWGNSKVANQNISCQHGENECYLNIIQACVINIWPNPKKHFGFIYCIERSGDKIEHHGPQAAWKACAKKMLMRRKPINRCYNSGYGRQLILKYANETDQLNPQHQYVPWLTVNNKPLYVGYVNFTVHVCHAYKGNAVPEACRSILSTYSTEKSPTHQACYAGKAAAEVDKPT